MQIGKYCFIVLLIIAVAAQCFAQDYPERSGYLNDYSWIFNREERQALEQELKEFHRLTDVQLVIVTVPSLRKEEVGAYTRGLAKEWGVAYKNDSRSILWVIAPGGLGIEVSSCLEPTLSDPIATKMMEKDVVPKFERGRMVEGIQIGARGIMSVFEKKN